jgi:hypothetical protein
MTAANGDKINIKSCMSAPSKHRSWQQDVPNPLWISINYHRAFSRLQREIKNQLTQIKAGSSKADDLHRERAAAKSPEEIFLSNSTLS